MSDRAGTANTPMRAHGGADHHESFLVYRKFKWLKIAALLSLVCFIAYLVHQPKDIPNGGTWLGYTLGGTGAALIVWLTWFGYRKRAYSSGAGRVQAWLSAHVYLGLALVVVATLHSGFRFAWNIHTFTYCLVLIVVASGIFGVFTYARYPSLMTANRRGLTTAQMMANIGAIDAELRTAASSLGDKLAALVVKATQETKVGGGVWEQLRGRPRYCGTDEAARELQTVLRQDLGAEEHEARKLMVLLTRKSQMLAQMRRDIQYKAMMDIWLYVHVPLAIALVVALATHVFAVFFY